jgi:hypothetical protein
MLQDTNRKKSMRALMVFTLVVTAGLDVSTERMVTVDEPTQLPWRKEITGRKKDYITLNAAPESGVAATCKLTVDGKEVATDTDTGGVVECRVG